MALINDLTDSQFGVDYKGVYFKIAYVRWSDVDNKMVATLSVFASEQAKIDGKMAIDSVEVDISERFGDINFIGMCYEQIKLNEQFINSEDSL